MLPGKPLGGRMPKQVQVLLRNVRPFPETYVSRAGARKWEDWRGGGGGGCGASGFVPRASSGLKGFSVGGYGGVGGGRCVCNGDGGALSVSAILVLRKGEPRALQLYATMNPHPMPRTHAVRSGVMVGDLDVWAMGK